jgi:hypothetical protein
LAPTAAAAPAETETPAAPPAKVELRRTTQEGLIAIQKSSEVKTEIHEEVARIEALEKKAVETTLKDIKAHDPKLYAQIEATHPRRVEQIHASAVQNLVKDAPKAPAKKKPFKSELEDLEQGAYEKYFQIKE